MALLHIPNGGARHVVVAYKLKKMGVRKGVHDLFLMARRGDYTMLIIEMKAGKNKLTPEQVEFKDMAEEYGAKCVTCWDWMDASVEIGNYLEGVVPDCFIKAGYDTRELAG